MKRVFFICEVAARDLPSRYAIGKRLLGMRLTEVYLLEQEFARILPSKYFTNSIVLDKSAADNPGRRKFYNKLKRVNATIFVEDQEGNSLLYNRGVYFTSRMTESSLMSIDKFFAWSAEHKNIITKKFPDLGYKVINSGSTNYDYIRIKSTESEKNPKYILYNSNFALITNYSSLDRYLRFRKSQVKFDMDYEKTITSMWAETQNNFKLFCDEIKKDIGKGYRIKIRHHPSEQALDLKRKLAKNGIHEPLLTNVDLVDDLKLAKEVKHIGCNSKLDAAIFKIPSYDIKKEKYDDMEQVYNLLHFGGLDCIAQEIYNASLNSHTGCIEFKWFDIKLFIVVSHLKEALVRLKSFDNRKTRRQKWTGYLSYSKLSQKHFSGKWMAKL